MDESEFDIELEKLYSAERKKEYYYLVSVEEERQAILTAFYDHYVSVSAFQDIATVDDFLSSLLSESGATPVETPSDDDFLPPLEAELNELMQKDIEVFDILRNGEMQVSGEGIYMVIPDEDGGNDVEILENGVTMIGDIQGYAVAPLIPYELFLRTQNGDAYESPSLDDISGEMPGVWLLMNNVVLADANGSKMSELDEVLVPLNYPSLNFNKVVRQQEVDTINAAELEEEQAPLVSHFKSDFMIEVCNDIENDLNHNGYEGEEAHEIRAHHQDELRIYMSGIDQEAAIRISAFTAMMLDGNEKQLEQELVRYLDSVIMDVRGTWRIVHAFETKTNDGSINIAHVLPEYMTEIRFEE